MKFFNPKEDVLDVQITKHGRNLLSRGSWKPAYYAFFDDNVLYDAQYGGVTESKNSAETRIQDETPLLRTQGNFTGCDEYLFELSPDDVHVGGRRKSSRLGTYEKLNVMPMSLGTTTLGSTKTPAYTMQFLEGEINKVEHNMTGSVRTANLPFVSTTAYSQQLLKIPQIDIDVTFQISVVSDPLSPEISFQVDPALTPGNKYADGYSVVVGPAQIIFIIEEESAPFDYRNFDIEVYEITKQVGPLGETVLEPLSFIKPLEMVKNNILLDTREAEIAAGRLTGAPPDVDPTFVQYYFDINVDDEIDENTLCRAMAELARKGESLFTDLEIVCPDLMTPIGVDIYGSDAIDEDCPDY
jgi:hypothetical protein